jgi:hypothetical protein
MSVREPYRFQSGAVLGAPEAPALPSLSGSPVAGLGATLAVRARLRRLHGERWLTEYTEADRDALVALALAEEGSA